MNGNNSTAGSNSNDMLALSYTSMILSSFTVLIISSLVMIYKRHKRVEQEISIKTNGIPVKSFNSILPVVGDLAMVLDPLNFQESQHSKYGNIFATLLLDEPHIQVSGPDLLDQLFYDNAKNIKMEGTKNINELLFGPSSIFTVSGEEHKRQRRMVINHLGVPVLNRVFPGIVKIFDDVIQEWYQATKDGSYINAVPAVERGIWKSMSLVVFGDDLTKEIDEELCHVMHTLALGLFALPIDLPFSTLGKAKVAKLRFQEMLMNEYKRRQAMPDKGVNRKDFFQAIINETCDDGFPEGFNMDTAITVIWASLDTTKSTAMLMINTMIDHAVEWARIRSDIENTFGPEGLLASDATFSRMEKEVPYVAACLKEVMRINGVGVVSIRRVVGDMTLKHNGKTYTVPAGYKICGNHFYNGINPESTIYSFPTSFIPERFLGDEAEDKVSGFKSATSFFGGGEKFCPGNPIARLQIQVFMGLMSKYKWTRKERVKEWTAIPFPVPRDGLHIRASTVN